MPLMEQELFTLSEHLSLSLVFSGVCVAWSLVFCVMYCRLLFFLFLLTIILSVLLRFTVSGYTFGIFQFFFLHCITGFVVRVTFLLIIVLSVLLRFTASGYTFGIFKLFFKTVIAINSSIEYDFLTILRYWTL